MKRRNILFLSIIIVLMLAFTACGGTETEDAVIYEETTDEEFVEYNLGFEGLQEVGGMVVYEEYGTSYSTGSLEVGAQPDITVEENLSDWDKILVGAEKDGDTFEGWLRFEWNITTDEEGNEVWNYNILDDGMVYSTEEVLAMAMPDEDMSFVAKWASISMEEYATIQ